MPLGQVMSLREGVSPAVMVCAYGGCRVLAKRVPTQSYPTLLAN